jgi:hypothetical protein
LKWSIAISTLPFLPMCRKKSSPSGALGHHMQGKENNGSKSSCNWYWKAHTSDLQILSKSSCNLHQFKVQRSCKPVSQILVLIISNITPVSFDNIHCESSRISVKGTLTPPTKKLNNWFTNQILSVFSFGFKSSKACHL